MESFLYQKNSPRVDALRKVGLQRNGVNIHIYTRLPMLFFFQQIVPLSEKLASCRPLSGKLAFSVMELTFISILGSQCYFSFNRSFLYQKNSPRVGALRKVGLQRYGVNSHIYTQLAMLLFSKQIVPLSEKLASCRRSQEKLALSVKELTLKSILDFPDRTCPS
ncbi:hypothetical protein J6590_028425 [Homalodisca vitripennis]|nr:hypothetical protein J6590_028425 [Homalodisca vitripennis]